MKSKVIAFTVALLAITLNLYAADADKSSGLPVPVLLTSCGQSADVLMMKGLAGRAGVPTTYMPFATEDSLKAFKSIIIVAGASSKGLGAAKSDPAVEEARVNKLLSAAKKAKLPVTVFHLGGESRRGALSDPFNKIAVEGADRLIVVKGGDDDGFFKKIAEAKKVSYKIVDNSAATIPVLSELYPKSKP